MLQLIINALISGGLLALVSWSFGIIFNTTKIFHIAHAFIYTLSVYLFIGIYSTLNNWYLSIILALTGSAIVAVIMELLVYRPLFKKGVNQNITLISSLGLQIIGINSVALLFGNETKMIENIKNYSYSFGDIIVTRVQFLQIGITVSIFLCVIMFFKYTNNGLKIRAVGDKHIIASAIGINVFKTRTIVFILGSVIAGIAALLKTIDIGIDPNSGMNIILSALVVVILNRKNSIIVLICISMVISILHNLTEWYFSSQVKEAVTYFLLIVVMLWRTKNILEYKMRVEEK